MKKQREQTWLVGLISVVMVSAAIAAMINQSIRTTSPIAKPVDRTTPHDSAKTTGTQSQSSAGND
jgi:hypothetical protein